MVKHHAVQFVRHCVGGGIALMPNIAVYAFLRSQGVAPIFQTVIAFIIGGQFAFAIHTFWSYRHRERKVTRRDVLQQYRMFMYGQALASSLNLTASWLITRYDPLREPFNMVAEPILAWLLGHDRDYWAMLYMFYLVPLAAGVAVSFYWTNWKSHRDE